jgi:hypothetical protein
MAVPCLIIGVKLVGDGISRLSAPRREGSEDER